MTVEHATERDARPNTLPAAELKIPAPSTIKNTIDAMADIARKWTTRHGSA